MCGAACASRVWETERNKALAAERSAASVILKRQVGLHATRPLEQKDGLAAMESHSRSIAKTLSWRLWATIITTAVVYFSTHEFKFAMEIGLLDTTIKLGAYFFHERLWNKVSFGRAVESPSDFEI